MQKRTVALAALTALAVMPAPAAQAKTQLNVIPWGQSEPGVNWTGTPGLLPNDTQARMYDRLTPLFRRVTNAQLVPSADGSGYFKDATLKREDDPSYVSSEVVSGTAPGFGTVSARLKRDQYGVPYIFSDTDAGATFASGYVAAEDRGLLIKQARSGGVAALIDLPNAPAINLILGLYDYKPSPAVLARAERTQTKGIEAQGARGRQLLSDIDVYVAGINAWFAEHDPSVKPLGRIDLYAINAVKAQFLGEGGGAELDNANLLSALDASLGRRRGDAAWTDLRATNDPDTTTTTTRRAHWQPAVPLKRAKGLVRLRRNSFRSSVPPLPGASAAAAASARPREHLASNILIASGRRSSTGSPLFAGGPQIGYNYPGLTYEEQLVSPSKRVRGATSAPFPGYMLIGSGENFAWTLTSAGADIVDTYAERLCGGSRTRYRYKGRCRRMTQVDAGTIAKNGKTVRFRYPQTVHGPVKGYARTRGGRLVAITTRRSSRGREAVDLLFNQDLTNGKVTDAKSFIRAAGRSPQTFNSFYANATQAAFFTSGRLPLRPRGVSPDLPVDGSGRYEWRGVLPNARHPQVTNPRSGYIVNWNNKPARGWPASDERFGNEGGPQRVDLLDHELDSRRDHTLASVLDAENAGATEDVRAQRFFDTLRYALGVTRAPSKRAEDTLQVLQAWNSSGGSRVDTDGDGKIDSPGATVMDTAWRGITDAGLCRRLGRSGCRALQARISRYDTPPGGQYSGWHQYMDKDLRTMLHFRVRGRYRLRYCGNGNLKRCSQDLWRAIDRAGATLTRRYGPDTSTWLEPAAKITYSPVPLIPMQYTNRPTGIHQVMTFGP